MKLFFLILNFFWLAACQGTPTKASPPSSASSSAAETPAKPTQPVDYFSQQGFKQVTFIGENDSPSFSETGNELIFISRQRPAHKGSQVYEIDLRKNIDRRITFHDGEDTSPSYINGREILYCSTTDEIKESPFLNKDPDKENPPMDIYLSDIYGSSIERITNYPGYDGEAVYVKVAQPFVVFTSRRGGLTGIYKLDLKTKQVSFLAVEKDKENRFPAMAADHKRLAWISKDLKSGKQSLKLMNLQTKKIETLKEGEDQYRDLIWAADSDQLYYSILRAKEKLFQLEVYDPNKKCTQPLFKGVDSLVQPAVSSEKKPKIAFVRLFPDQKQDKKQIYIVDLPENLGPCLEPAPAPKLEK